MAAQVVVLLGPTRSGKTYDLVGRYRAVLENASAAKFDSRGLAYLKIGNAQSSVADYNAALGINPRLAGALYGRGLAKRLAGDAAGGNADVAAATAIDGGIAAEFARYGLR